MKKISLLSLFGIAIVACLVGTNDSYGMEFNKKDLSIVRTKLTPEQKLQRHHLSFGAFVAAVTFPLMRLKNYPINTSAKCSLIVGVSTFIGTEILRHYGFWNWVTGLICKNNKITTSQSDPVLNAIN